MFWKRRVNLKNVVGFKMWSNSWIPEKAQMMNEPRSYTEIVMSSSERSVSKRPIEMHS